MTHAPRSRYGIIWWQGRTLAYLTEGGSYRAHFVGDHAPVPMTDELRAIIEADAEKQKRKDAGKE